MKKQRFVVVFLAVMALMLTACSGSNDKNNVRFGSGREGGNYFNYANSLSGMIADSSDFSVEVKETAGSAANIRLLDQGFLDMAIVQSDTFSDALNGTRSFSDGAIDGLKSVTGLYTESCQIVTLDGKEIESIADLKGKKISIGEKDSGVVQNARLILKMAGISEADFSVHYMSFSDSAEALKKGDIDAFFCTASAPTTAIVELAENMKIEDKAIKLLSISDLVKERILAESDAYVVSTIPAGTYVGVDSDIQTVGVSAVLVAREEVDEAVTNTFLKVLTEHNEEIMEISFGKPVKQEEEGRIFTFSFDMYMTLALAVFVLFIGARLKKKVKFLETFCIPAPVIGGLIFAVFSCVLFVTGVAEFSFDETLKNICMIMFFTSVGFQANLKVLKSGGISLLIFLGCVFVLIVGQNTIAVTLSKLMDINPLIGMSTGSIPMVGGHGTAGAFGQVLEDLGLNGATTLCTAAATFGLIAGSLMGGPVGRRLILKHDLLKTAMDEDDSVLVEDEAKHKRSVSKYAPAAYQMAIAMGIGTIVSTLLSKTGMTFPVYIGAMIVAAFMRNIGEYSGKFRVHMGEINDIGGICLSFFLGIAMVTLKLWQLADLALPLMVLLLAQGVLMFLFAYFVVYNIMGRNYDAAILSAGTCGFGMGATPNAMANMQALTDKYAPSVKAYLLVPIVGSMFADFINSLAITFFINII